ncbi:hypothetical protein QWY93_13535 [Echinicola jeungdonensis]|uniref:NIPSNAP protein n=1 Tax=Echinicola jeungdonensis TaxID=709343 RepID=A0ABV5J953_9BACT|nr:hypothetical protein [Echinicola jeungdonensis]MDN3670294.1 hypothetical protein [Echinicola jeungdonensis]MDN3670340.1 hypothetical protein [Echinicola jeungdonensis]
MKKLFYLVIIVALVCPAAIAQEEPHPKYLVIEFIKVDSDNMVDFSEAKGFLEGIYKEAVKQGEIEGWDLWTLQSGPERGEFQYVTITYYDDPVKMMNGMTDDNLQAYAERAHSTDMSEQQLELAVDKSVNNRDLALRAYMVEIAHTKDDFEMKPGVLASFDLMKAAEGRFNEYEQMEKQLYLPFHQKKIEADMMGSWRLLRTAVPMGSEAEYTHMTLNFYDNYMQFFNAQEYEDLEASEERQMAMEEGLKSREQKWVYLATLLKSVR